MARRNNKGLVDGIFGLSASMPWWVSVMLAVISFVVLRMLAAPGHLPDPARAPVADVAVATLIQGAAHVGQYLLPGLFLLGAALSAWLRRKRLGLPDQVATIESGAPVVSCPNCGAPMMTRMARQGANAGRKFLGCSTFPKCRGVRDLPD